MLIALKIILGLLGLVLLMLSLRWIFTTKSIAAEHHIDYSTATGANYLKGDIGGILLFGAAMVPLFLFHSQSWIYPIMLLLACVIICRIISLAQEGYSKQGVIAIVVEVIMMVVSYGIFALS